MSKICFLINPRSGGGAGEVIGRKLESIIRERGLDAALHTIAAFNEAQAAISDPQTERIIVVGGDGTVSSLLPCLLKSSPVLGILPLGTGNDLAKELGLFRSIRPSNVEKALVDLLDSTVRKLTVWLLKFGPGLSRSRLFCNYASFGFDALAVRSFHEVRLTARPLPGCVGVLRNRLLYLEAGLGHLRFKLGESLRVTGGEGDIDRAATALFTNLKSYMGIAHATSNGSPFDGKIEYVLLRGPCDYLSTVSRRLTGAPRNVAPSRDAWAGSALEPVHIQLDGELVEEAIEGDFVIEKAGTIKVLCRE